MRVVFVALVAAAAFAVAAGASQTESPLIAFSADRDGNTDVYTARLDGSELRRVTTSPGADYDASWSPDRSQIAYRCQVGTTSDICVVAAHGGAPRHVVATEGDEWSPAWSPDGGWIAFFSEHYDPGSVWIVRPDGSGLERLAPGGEYPTWSRDARFVAYGDLVTRDIALVRRDGRGGKRILARHRAYDMSPSFAPGGRAIAFDSQRGYKRVRERGIGPEFEIYRVGTNGRRVVRLTKDRVEDRFPDYGPDGRIVWSRAGALWIMNGDGSQKRRLPLEGSFPDW